MSFLFSYKFKLFIKSNIYLFLILQFTFRGLPLFIKKMLLPHEYDYYILKKIRFNRKIKILDIGGGFGESIISFYKISKNIAIDTYEPNPNNYKYCSKLKEKYSNLEVFNYAYGSPKKKTLLIPKFNKFHFDNFSGFKETLIRKNFKTLFNEKRISFSKQKIIFKKSKKKFDLIKVDCETDFYGVIKDLASNIKKETVIMIENSKDSKKIFSYLKKINKNYKCYFFNNSELTPYDIKNSNFDAKILNLIFMPKI